MFRIIVFPILILTNTAAPSLAADSVPTGTFFVNLTNALIVYAVGIVISFATAFGITTMGAVIRRFNKNIK